MNSTYRRHSQVTCDHKTISQCSTHWPTCCSCRYEDAGLWFRDGVIYCNFCQAYKSTTLRSEGNVRSIPPPISSTPEDEGIWYTVASSRQSTGGRPQHQQNIGAQNSSAFEVSDLEFFRSLQPVYDVSEDFTQDDYLGLWGDDLDQDSHDNNIVFPGVPTSEEAFPPLGSGTSQARRRRGAAAPTVQQPAPSTASRARNLPSGRSGDHLADGADGPVRAATAAAAVPQRYGVSWARLVSTETAVPQRYGVDRAPPLRENNHSNSATALEALLRQAVIQDRATPIRTESPPPARATASTSAPIRNSVTIQPQGGPRDTSSGRKPKILFDLLGNQLENSPPKAIRSSEPSTVASQPPLDQNQTPPSIDIAETAKDAARLLELFSRIFPRDSGTAPEYVFNDAFAKLLSIQKEFRLKAVQNNQDIKPTDLDSEELKIDAGCIICCSCIADTVVMPCGHLAICSECCDQMGVQSAGVVWRRTVHCPICRAVVLDKIKVFRS